jgi:AcrR family transcriptional regulator
MPTIIRSHTTRHFCMSSHARPLSGFLHQIPVQDVLAKKRWTREDWVVFGLDALEKEGPSAIRIEELARRAGRTPGSFYAHFKSRDQLLDAMLQAWLEFKVERARQLDSQLFHEGRFTLEALATLVVQGGVMARMQLELVVRQLALTDERARFAVTRLDTERLHNGTAMVNAEFPRAAHPQVFAMLWEWMNYGRMLAFVDTSDEQLAASAPLVLQAFVQMYQSTAASFKVAGAPKWKSKFVPLPVEELRRLDPTSLAPDPRGPASRKRRRRS